MEPKHIKTIRAWFGLTQQELADKLGVSQNAVARWETGSRHPTGSAVTLLTGLLVQVAEQMQGESSAA